MGKKRAGYQRLFAELKRRKVFNTAALFGGASFVVIQAADFMVPALHLPEAVSTVIAVLALVGFPISMALAWTFDLTASGIRRTEPSSEPELDAIVALPGLRRWPVGLAAAGGLSLFVLAVVLELGMEGSRAVQGSLPTESAIESLAVMPLLTFGEDGGEYLGEGISEELLDALSRIPGLRVTSRTSAFSLPEEGADPASALRDLRVDALLEGSVARRDRQVELALRLVTRADGDADWTQTFHLPEEGFFAALDEVTWVIAQVVGAGVPQGPRARLVPEHTSSFPAYADFLRGRHAARRGTPEALGSAIESYHRALLLDPGFSSAWAALATAYVLLPETGGPPFRDVLPYAQAALDRAMAPGSETADGYAASGYLKWAYLWDLPAADADFRRANEMDPDNPVSRAWRAQLLATDRRWDEALEEARRAVDLDPRSPSAFMALGLVLMGAGRDEAPAAFRRALELAPDMHPAAYVLGGLLAMRGDLDGAAQAFDRFASLTHTDGKGLRAYLAALSDPSRRPEAVTALQDRSFFGAVQGAELLAHLGEDDAALALLERAVEERSLYLPWVNTMPQYERLRSDRRFQSILAWVKF